MMLPNLTYFGHDSPYYITDHRRTMHHTMIKQIIISVYQKLCLVLDIQAVYLSGQRSHVTR